MVFLWRLEVSFVLTINFSFNNFLASQLKVVLVGQREGWAFREREVRDASQKTSRSSAPRLSLTYEAYQAGYTLQTSEYKFNFQFDGLLCIGGAGSFTKLKKFPFGDFVSTV